MMERRARERIFLILGLVVVFLVVFLLSLQLLFPYKKALGVLVSSLFSESKIKFSVVGAQMRAYRFHASEVRIGYEDLASPILCVRNVEIRCNPFALLKGALGIRGENYSSPGRMVLTIENIPIFSRRTPILLLQFKDVPVSAFVQGQSPFRAIGGRAEGWIKEQIYPLSPERNKGSFLIRIRDGELEDLYLKPLPRFALPFREILLRGSFEGNVTRIDRLVVESALGSISGGGTISKIEGEQKLEVALSLTGFKGTPAWGRRQIKVTGSIQKPSFEFR